MVFVGLVLTGAIGALKTLPPAPNLIFFNLLPTNRYSRYLRKVEMVFSHGSFRILILISLFTLGVIKGTSATTPAPDAVELYNRACDASGNGLSSQALDLFRQAVQAGFDDFVFAQADPDLINLITSPGFENLLMAHQSRLTLLSSELGFELQSGIWTPWEKLGSVPKQEQDPVAVRLKWEPQGLNYELSLTGSLARSFAEQTPPPWDGGPKIVFTLAVTDETSPFESANTFHFLLGKNKTSGVGSLYLGPGSGWQQVVELAPKLAFKDHGRTVTVTGSISWQSILPFHPLVDPNMGLNVAVQSNNPDCSPRILLPDPRVFAPESQIHRFVPLFFNSSTTSHEAMVARLNHSVIEDTPLKCDLKVISSAAGTGYLKVDFLDTQGHSVLPGGAQSEGREFVAGVNTTSHSADFRALRMGPYLVKVDLEMPSGATWNWSSLVLNMGPDWEGKLQKRIEKLAIQDQPTANFYLHTVATAIKEMPTRRNPGSMTTTLMELDSFLEAGSTQGSILPQSGVFLLVRKDTQGRQRFCSLYLPEGYKNSSRLEPVILWADAAGSERSLTERLGKICESPKKLPQPSPAPDKSFPIYLVPHSPTGPLATRADEVADLQGFLNWVQDYFKTEKVALAGVNSAAGAVLEFSLQEPEVLSRILVFSGSRMDPWPHADTASLTKKFSTRTAGHPAITWIDFVSGAQPTEEKKLLLSVLDKAGYLVKPIQVVKADLNLAQVADRLVLWAK